MSTDELRALIEAVPAGELEITRHYADDDGQVVKLDGFFIYGNGLPLLSVNLEHCERVYHD